MISFIRFGNSLKTNARLISTTPVLRKRRSIETIKTGLTLSILGPPNAGKSTLFNRLLLPSSRLGSGKKRDSRRGGRAIVTDVAGTTRDRRECDGVLAGMEFKVFDTAGVDEGIMFAVGKGKKSFTPSPASVTSMRAHEVITGANAGGNQRLRELTAEDLTMSQHMGDQVVRAALSSDLILVLFDGRECNIEPVKDICVFLRKNGALGGGKRIQLLANKLEGDAWLRGERGDAIEDFLEECGRLGFGDVLGISSAHGDGMADLATIIHEMSVEKKGEEESNGDDYERDDGDHEHGDSDLSIDHDEAIPSKPSLAIIGRQNVGKSTLLNSILGDARVVTGSTPGLTRDSISVSHFHADSDRTVEIVDTAGIRKFSKRDKSNDIEQLSVEDASRAMKLANVAVVVLDANEGQLTRQELGIVDKVIEEGRGLVIAANKYDLLEAEGVEIHEYAAAVKDQLKTLLPHVGECYVVAMSALKGQYVDQLIPVVLEVHEKWNTRINTGVLNAFLNDAVERHPPPSVNNRPIRLKYITQVGIRPPSFRIFSNMSESDLGESYLRYLRNNLRAAFGMQGVPLRFHIRKQDASKNPFAGGKLGRNIKSRRRRRQDK